jgi:hypothetical protein
MPVIGPDVLAMHHLSLMGDKQLEDNEAFLRKLRGVTKEFTIFGLLDQVGIVASRIGDKSARELYISYLKSREHVILFPEYQGS